MVSPQHAYQYKLETSEKLNIRKRGQAAAPSSNSSHERPQLLPLKKQVVRCALYH